MPLINKTEIRRLPRSQLRQFDVKLSLPYNNDSLKLSVVMMSIFDAVISWNLVLGGCIVL